MFITGPEGLLVLDVATRKEIKRLALGKSDHEEILFALDGARVYIPSDNDPGKVAIIDMKTLEITGYLSTGKHPESMAWVERAPQGTR